MHPRHQSIDIPLSSIVNDEAALGAAVGVSPSSDSRGQISSTLNHRLPQAETNSKDGSESLSSMYNEKALEFNSKHLQNWREDANGLMILSGLVSAAVSGFLAQSYIAFQTNAQDVSAFYLSQLYQASLNGSVSSSTPAPLVPASAHDASHRSWFVCLVMSLFCAVGATFVQEWIRRYQLLTLLRSSPHSRESARLRASVSRNLFLELIPLVLKCLNLLLHLSIYLFLYGLAMLPSSFGDKPTSRCVRIACLFAFLGYLLFTLGSTLIPSPRPRILFSSLLLPTYGRDILTSSFWSTLVGAALNIEEDASTPPLALDADAMSWLLGSLTDEEEYEQFLAGIPGFYRSTQVEDPAKVLQQANTETSPKVILAFMDRSLSSDLPEEKRQRRIKVSLEAMQIHPYLLHRTFHHALRACSTESAIFKSVDFVLLADQHANDKNLNICLLARCIITVAINRLEDYHVDKRWAGIVQRRLNWPEELLHWEQRDSIKLRNLIQLARELNTPRPDSDTFSPEALGHLLREACKLNVGNVAPKLQDDFCDLWNELVIAAQLPDQDPALLSNVVLILSFIRAVHVSLHQGTESESSTPPANTNDLGPVLQNLSSYSPCTVPHYPVTSADPSTNLSVALDSGDA